MARLRKLHEAGEAKLAKVWMEDDLRASLVLGTPLGRQQDRPVPAFARHILLPQFG